MDVVFIRAISQAVRVIQFIFLLLVENFKV